MFKEALVPINVEGLHLVKINDSLYRKLPLKARINDQRLRGLNTFLARGTGPLAEIFNQLCNIEALLKADCKNKITLNDSNVLVIENTMINFTDMRRCLGKSIRLLTAAHFNILQRRKVSLHAYIDKKFHYLTRETNPVTSELLGSDLEQKISDSLKTSEAAKRLTPRQFSRFRTPSSRGRRPYFSHRQYTGQGHRDRHDNNRFRRNCDLMPRGRHTRGQPNYRTSRGGRPGFTRSRSSFRRR